MTKLTSIITQLKKKKLLTEKKPLRFGKKDINRGKIADKVVLTKRRTKKKEQLNNLENRRRNTQRKERKPRSKKEISLS